MSGREIHRTTAITLHDTALLLFLRFSPQSHALRKKMELLLIYYCAPPFFFISEYGCTSRIRFSPLS